MLRSRIYYLIGVGLRGETDLDGHELLSVELVQEDVLDVGGLARTRGAHEEGLDIVVDEKFLKVGVTDGVDGRYNDVLDLGTFGELI